MCASIIKEEHMFIFIKLELFVEYIIFFLMLQTFPSSNLQVWIYNLGLGFLIYEVEKICDGSGEDPDCSR